MQYLIGLVVALFGGVLFFRNKAQNAQALNENSETKEKVNKEDIEIAKNDAREEAERAKREVLQGNLQKEMSKDVKGQELASFFNDRNPGDGSGSSSTN